MDKEENMKKKRGKPSLRIPGKAVEKKFRVKKKQKKAQEIKHGFEQNKARKWRGNRKGEQLKKGGKKKFTRGGV